MKQLFIRDKVSQEPAACIHITDVSEVSEVVAAVSAITDHDMEITEVVPCDAPYQMTLEEYLGEVECYLDDVFGN